MASPVGIPVFVENWLDLIAKNMTAIVSATERVTAPDQASCLFVALLGPTLNGNKGPMAVKPRIKMPMGPTTMLNHSAPTFSASVISVGMPPV
ncbi:MAG: hypothetical protein BWX66_01051 [Deltaproteobacteria bacterium ADurb.Bin058]|nr:MAG: hypothetical protein BWX66_01051 [Deltaproteobacteria bacterium ADurb.Bin058]